MNSIGRSPFPRLCKMELCLTDMKRNHLCLNQIASLKWTSLASFSHGKVKERYVVIEGNFLNIILQKIFLANLFLFVKCR
ncbi:hypothetical protein GDO81_008615 [Engystomops pustulosus]|uniref:Uncharacterized protein n=1 Tax=Engystomops pustulosus TaxID=76066 RepID=A0AAV7CFY3_ENGPU|nr:hypothetical protein GDO81_008615 [Engystomops pustulosus]